MKLFRCPGINKNQNITKLSLMLPSSVVHPGKEQNYRSFIREKNDFE